MIFSLNITSHIVRTFSRDYHYYSKYVYEREREKKNRRMRGKHGHIVILIKNVLFISSDNITTYIVLFFLFSFIVSDFDNIYQRMTQIEIPSELPSILRNFTLSVLRTKPRDIVDHAVDYFTQLQRQQKQQSGQPIIGNHPVTTASPSSCSSTSQQSQQQQQQSTSNHNAISSGP